MLIDELKNLPKMDQIVQLSLMQNGLIAETKLKKTRQTQLKTWDLLQVTVLENKR